MAGFSIPLAQLAAKLKLDVETVARKSTLDVFAECVRQSPVGNPDIWKANAGKKRGDKGFVGKGYVGGRFRANWNVSYGTADTSTTASVDQSRADSEVRKALTLPVGGVVYLTNGLPYARELEYGHSTQAPQGMVRMAALNFSDYVQKAIAK